MKKLFGKLLSLTATVALMLSMCTLPASAAGAETKIYFQNSQNWKEVSAYFWAGSGGIEGLSAWPGEKMEKLEGDWYVYTYKSDKAFNVIFNDNGSTNPPATAQSANHTPADLSADKEAYWFTLATGTSDNSDGISSGTNVTIYETPQDGWPKPTAATTGTNEGASPKTGAAFPVIAIVFASLAAAGCGLSFATKKSR